MGDHAQDCVNMCIDHEAEWDEYASGNMSDYEAYDKGITDSQGYADSRQLDRALARNPIPTLDNLNNQLSHAVKDLALSQYDNNHLNYLNEEAQANLYNGVPTCNCCRKPMQPREGRYGKFYFCPCPDQPTVSDKYWQKVRK